MRASSIEVRRYRLGWNGRSGSEREVAEGIDFIRLVIDALDKTRKVLVVKEPLEGTFCQGDGIVVFPFLRRSPCEGNRLERSFP